MSLESLLVIYRKKIKCLKPKERKKSTMTRTTKVRNAYAVPARQRTSAGPMDKKVPRRIQLQEELDEAECKFKHLSHNTYCTNCGMCDVECGIA